MIPPSSRRRMTRVVRIAFIKTMCIANVRSFSMYVNQICTRLPLNKSANVHIIQVFFSDYRMRFHFEILCSVLAQLFTSLECRKMHNLFFFLKTFPFSMAFKLNNEGKMNEANEARSNISTMATMRSTTCHSNEKQIHQKKYEMSNRKKAKNIVCLIIEKKVLL